MVTSRILSFLFILTCINAQKAKKRTTRENFDFFTKKLATTTSVVLDDGQWTTVKTSQSNPSSLGLTSASVTKKDASRFNFTSSINYNSTSIIEVPVLRPSSSTTTLGSQSPSSPSSKSLPSSSVSTRPSLKSSPTSVSLDGASTQRSILSSISNSIAISYLSSRRPEKETENTQSSPKSFHDASLTSVSFSDVPSDLTASVILDPGSKTTNSLLLSSKSSITSETSVSEASTKSHTVPSASTVTNSVTLVGSSSMSTSPDSSKPSKSMTSVTYLKTSQSDKENNSVADNSSNTTAVLGDVASSSDGWTVDTTSSESVKSHSSSTATRRTSALPETSTVTMTVEDQSSNDLGQSSPIPQSSSPSTTSITLLDTDSNKRAEITFDSSNYSTKQNEAAETTKKSFQPTNKEKPSCSSPKLPSESPTISRTTQTTVNDGLTTTEDVSSLLSLTSLEASQKAMNSSGTATTITAMPPAEEAISMAFASTINAEKSTSPAMASGSTEVPTSDKTTSSTSRSSSKSRTTSDTIGPYGTSMELDTSTSTSPGNSSASMDQSIKSSTAEAHGKNRRIEKLVQNKILLVELLKLIH